MTLPILFILAPVLEFFQYCAIVILCDKSLSEFYVYYNLVEVKLENYYIAENYFNNRRFNGAYRYSILGPPPRRSR